MYVGKQACFNLTGYHVDAFDLVPLVAKTFVVMLRHVGQTRALSELLMSFAGALHLLVISQVL